MIRQCDMRQAREQYEEPVAEALAFLETLMLQRGASLARHTSDAEADAALLVIVEGGQHM